MAQKKQRSQTGLAKSAVSGSSVQCHIDELSGSLLRGWAFDKLHPNVSPTLHIIVDGQQIDTVLCADPRPDVVASGLSMVNVGYRATIPAILADNESHRLTIRDSMRRDVPIYIAGQDFAYLDFRTEFKPAVFSHIDGVRYGAFEGWVMQTEQHAEGLHGNAMVRITCDGVTIGHVRANQHRGDVARAVGGPSNCGFRFSPPQHVRSGHPRQFGFFLMPLNLELDGSPLQTSLVDDEAQSRLIDLVAAVDAMHRDLTRIRRQLHEIAPKPRYSVAEYDHWFRLYEPALERRIAAEREARAKQPGPASRPLVTIVCPVYRPAMEDFEAAVGSVMEQTYENFELIMVDDNSRDAVLSAFMAALAERDPRVRVIRNRKNQGISGATNTALKAAKGEWVAFFDHDDLMVRVAIECMVDAALASGASMLYSDEDKLDAGGTYIVPSFKPDWNHRLMLGVNYVCHLLFVRRTLIEKAGLLDSAYDGAQDHEFILRLSEHVAPEGIHHVPEVLYHWRITPGSTAETISNKGYAVAAGAKAVADHLARLGRPAQVETIEDQTLYKQAWTVTEEPKVSIIIPYKDQIETTEQCLQAVLSTTDYANYDVILIDNWSTSKEAVGFARRVGKMARVRILRIEEDFNYSRLNNLAAASTDAAFLVFMNNDLFVQEDRWLRAIVGEAVADPQVGAVGGKFHYPDGSIQHAGVVTGIGGVAGHVHVGVRAGENGYGGRLLFAQEMTAVTAAGMLVRKSAFDQVGGFDERQLRIAFNDIDLCLKLRQAGFKVIWTPDFVAEHHESLSRGDDERPAQETRFFDEIEVMKERWGAALKQDPFYHPKFVLDRQPFFDLVDPDGSAPG